MSASNVSECLACGAQLCPSRDDLGRYLQTGETQRTRECPACYEKAIAKRHGQASLERMRRDRAEQQEAARRVIEAIRSQPAAALAQIGVPPRWQRASFEDCTDLPRSLLDRLRGWAEAPAGTLYLFSNSPGTGKTTAAVAAIWAGIATGLLSLGDCRFVGESEYLASLKVSFGKATNPTEPLKRIRMLLLDDLGSRMVTDWRRDELAALIACRHAHELPTIITSNHSLTEIAQTIDARTASRLAESGLALEFPSVDLRLMGGARLRAAAEKGRRATDQEQQQ